MNVNQIVGKKEDYRQVKVVIGGDAVDYDSSKSHFEIQTSVETGSGFVYLLLPESVAEYFRKQGRRELQSEFRQLLNSARA